MKHVSLVMAYDGQGRLLFGKRRDNQKFTLPGGGAEEGEEPVATARRELFEETGLVAISLSYFKTISTPDMVLTFFTAYVRGTPHSDNDPDDECEKWEFVDVSEGIPENVAKKLQGPPGDENLLLQVFKIKKSEPGIETMEDLIKAQATAKPKSPNVGVPPKVWRSKDGIKVPGITHPDREEYHARFVQSLANYFTKDGNPNAFKKIRVPITNVHTINPVHNEHRYDMYGKMYRAGDQPPPLLVRKNAKGNYIILDGNHRFHAAKATGQSHVYALEAPVEGVKKHEGIDFPSIDDNVAEYDALESLIKEEIEHDGKNEIDRMIELGKFDVALMMDGLNQRQIAHIALRGPTFGSGSSASQKLDSEGLSHLINEYATKGGIMSDKENSALRAVAKFADPAHKPFHTTDQAVVERRKGMWTPQNRKQFYDQVIKSGLLVEAAGGDAFKNEQNYHVKSRMLTQHGFDENVIPFVLAGADKDTQIEFLDNHNWINTSAAHFIAKHTPHPETLDHIVDNADKFHGGATDMAMLNPATPVATLVRKVKDAVAADPNDEYSAARYAAEAAMGNPSLPSSIVPSLIEHGSEYAHRLVFHYINSGHILDKDTWKAAAARATTSNMFDDALAVLQQQQLGAHLAAATDAGVHTLKEAFPGDQLGNMLMQVHSRSKQRMLGIDGLLTPEHTHTMLSDPKLPEFVKETMLSRSHRSKLSSHIDDSVLERMFKDPTVNARDVFQHIKDPALVEKLAAEPSLVNAARVSSGLRSRDTNVVPTAQTFANLADVLDTVQEDPTIPPMKGLIAERIGEGNTTNMSPEHADRFAVHSPYSYITKKKVSQGFIDRMVSERLNKPENVPFAAGVMNEAARKGYNVDKHINRFLDGGPSMQTDPGTRDALLGAIRYANTSPETNARILASGNRDYLKSLNENRSAIHTPETRRAMIAHGLTADYDLVHSHHFSAPELNAQDLSSYINTASEDRLEYVLDGVAKSPHFNKDLLKEAYDRVRALPSHKVGGMLNALNDAASESYPDMMHDHHVNTKMGTARLRRVRDHILESGADELPPNKLPKEVQPLLQNMPFARTKSGNISAKQIQAAIDATPSTRFNVSHGTWGGAQRHSDETSNVFQVNLNDEHVKQMKQAGVWDTFKRFQAESGHPITPTTVGWVRYTESDPVEQLAPGQPSKHVQDVLNTIKDHPHRLTANDGEEYLKPLAHRGFQQAMDHQKGLPVYFDYEAHNAFANAHSDYGQGSTEDFPTVDESKASFREKFAADVNELHEGIRAGTLSDDKERVEKLNELLPAALADYKSGAQHKTKAMNDLITTAWGHDLPWCSRTKGHKHTGPESDGIFIDEIQSDHHMPLAAKAKGMAKERAKQSALQRLGRNPEPHEQLEIEAASEKHAQSEWSRVNDEYPEEHQRKISDIVFGKHHANKVLMESFLEHLRSKGQHNRKLHIHTIESKAPISLGTSPDRQVPVHFKETYRELPKELGFKPATYGTIGTETGEIKQPIQEGVARKHESWDHEYQQLCKAIMHVTNMHIQRSSHSEPAVDHTKESFHPASAASREKFNKEIVEPKELAPAQTGGDVGLNGCQAKAVWRQPGQRPEFMAKPYHEKHPGFDGWAEHPINGWSEETYQHMMHAGGMGHHVQKSFVHHDGPTAMSVIHIDPHAGRLSGYRPHMAKRPEVQDQAKKIALFDFLSNNLDRHHENMMSTPVDPATDEGEYDSPRNLLAIDNSLGFQYMNSTKSESTYEHEDSIHKYVTYQAPGDFAPIDVPGNYRNFGEEYPPNDELWKNTMEEWWPSVKHHVVSSVLDRLHMVKDEKHRKHIETNFMDRVKHLDKIAEYGVEEFPHWHTAIVKMDDTYMPSKHSGDEEEPEENDDYDDHIPDPDNDWSGISEEIDRNHS